jgi:hypothetical protein
VKILIDTNVVLDIALNRTPGSGPPGRKHPPKEKRRETWIGFTAFLCLLGFLGLSRVRGCPLRFSGADPYGFPLIVEQSLGKAIGAGLFQQMERAKGQKGTLLF